MIRSSSTHRLAAGLLCSALTLSLAGCSGKGTGNVPGTDTTTTGTFVGVPTGTGVGTPTGSTGLSGSDVIQFEGAVPKNILFLSVDTMRKDHMGVHSDLGLTPFLDTLAAEGVVMNKHHQCSNWTFGSTTCTLAGRSNIDRGHIPRLNGTQWNRPPVPYGTPFLATWLGEAGYWSAIVSANDWLSASWGNTQGYTRESKPFGNALDVTTTGLELLTEAQANGEVPDGWFLHLHHMEPHASYDPEPQHIVGIDQLEPWPDDLTNRNVHYGWRDAWPAMDPAEQDLLEQHLRLLYAAEIRTLDERLATNWQILDEGGFLDDTLVVLWNDHGEAFWEHGVQTHAYNLTGEENDGYLIFWSKNIVANTWDENTAAIDLVPTLLDLQGIDIPPEVTGKPIGTADPDRPIFTEVLARLGGAQAVIVEDRKLHYNWFDGGVRVWDRSTDPEEQVDLYDPTDPQTLELWTLLKPQVEAMAPLIVDEQPTPTWPADLP